MALEWLRDRRPGEQLAELFASSLASGSSGGAQRKTLAAFERASSRPADEPKERGRAKLVLCSSDQAEGEFGLTATTANKLHWRVGTRPRPVRAEAEEELPLVSNRELPLESSSRDSRDFASRIWAGTFYESCDASESLRKSEATGPLTAHCRAGGARVCFCESRASRRFIACQPERFQGDRTEHGGRLCLCLRSSSGGSAMEKWPSFESFGSCCCREHQLRAEGAPRRQRGRKTSSR